MVLYSWYRKKVIFCTRSLKAKPSVNKKTDLNNFEIDLLPGGRLLFYDIQICLI